MITTSILFISVVAPRRGAWIETFFAPFSASRVWESHPAGVRGLKPLKVYGVIYGLGVAPRRGAWIETGTGCALLAKPLRRTPQGCVD